MRVLIHVCAMDEERGVKSTREDVVEVPGKVIKLFEILGGDQNEILKRVGDTVFAAAMREIQAGKVDLTQALVEASGGRIGGRGPGPGPVVEAAPAVRVNAPAPAAPAPAGGDPLAAMLGLDIIRSQVQRERSEPRQPGPGAIGFPRR